MIHMKHSSIHSAVVIMIFSLLPFIFVYLFVVVCV